MNEGRWQKPEYQKKGKVMPLPALKSSEIPAYTQEELDLDVVKPNFYLWLYERTVVVLSFCAMLIYMGWRWSAFVTHPSSYWISAPLILSETCLVIPGACSRPRRRRRRWRCGCCLPINPFTRMLGRRGRPYRELLHDPLTRTRMRTQNPIPPTPNPHRPVHLVLHDLAPNAAPKEASGQHEHPRRGQAHGGRAHPLLHRARGGGLHASALVFVRWASASACLQRPGSYSTRLCLYHRSNTRITRADHPRHAHGRGQHRLPQGQAHRVHLRRRQEP